MNKALYLLLFALLPCMLFAQSSLKDIRKSSYQLLAYKVSANQVEKYIKEDSIPVDQFVNQTPVFTFHKDSFKTEQLQTGNYVLISVVDNKLFANLIGITNLIVYPVNNRTNIQLDIRTQEGNFVEDAKVWINDKAATYDKASKNYWSKQKTIDKGLVKVYTATDTTFINIEARDDRISPTWRQHLKNFKNSTTGRIITCLPTKFLKLFKKHGRNNKLNSGATGYMLFNQPKYKLTDTVKLKAYIVNKKWKRFTGEAKIYLEYRAKGKFTSQLLTSLKPVSPGSFVYSFPLSDTLVSDIIYTIVFKDKEGRNIIRKTFSTEDYLLDEIGSYTLRTTREDFFQNDTMTFYASAKDANGLSLLDGKAKLVLTTIRITDFYKDTVQVADTLFSQEKMLATDEETKFTISTKNFPNAKLEIKASLIFINSNNEMHEESKEISYSPEAKEFFVYTKADTVFATYRVNGKPLEANGTVDLYGNELERKFKVTFPVSLKVDPLAEEYKFTVINGMDTIVKSVEINSRYSLTLSRINKQDTLGFTLNNPYKIPITYIVLDGNKIISKGKDDKEQITWTTINRNKRKIYIVKWQYNWAGEQLEGSENIATLHKLLKIKLDNQPIVFPGQKDTISIEVRDYKNIPARGVNLAAVAYNSQFKKAINVKEPPYLAKYKNTTSIVRERHETSDAFILKQYKLGNHTDWIKRLSLDTVPYYKILFPKSYPYDVVTPIDNFIPQVSIHVVKKGEPQEIYLLYLNRQLVYYNGVTDKMKYAFQTMQGFTQVGVRLLDKYLQIDSLYIQPFYKHDLVIDLDSLPKHSIVKDIPIFWSNNEKNLLESSIWQLDNNQKTNNGFIWQNDKVVKLSNSIKHLAGPFRSNDSLHFFAPGNFDIHFVFEPGYEYNLSNKIARLEKKSLFAVGVDTVMLKRKKESYLLLGDTITGPPAIIYLKPLLDGRFIKLSEYATYNPYNHIPNNGKLQFTVHKDTTLKYVILYNKDTLMTNVVLNGTTRSIKSIKPGIYTLLLVDSKFRTAQINNLQIKRNQTLCIDSSKFSYLNNNNIVEKLIFKSIQRTPIQSAEIQFNNNTIIKDELPDYLTGSGRISGRVIDAVGGNAIPGATVFIKGTTSGVSAGPDGRFIINKIKEGRYTLIISSVGYYSKEVVVNYTESQLIIKLNAGSGALSEVVVTTALGVQRRASLTASTVRFSDSELSSGYLQNTLQGQVGGLRDSAALERNKINIRGAASYTGNNSPIYIIDGIIYNELPAHIKPEMIQSTEVLKAAEATALFGARGTNGAIVITTGTKSARSKFQDYAFWQPELFTNEDGKVSFEVVYPDNITGWELYVLGMDKKRRMGKGMSFTKAYKPLLAQLNTPQFLITNDTAHLIAKALNYTTDNYSIKTKLSIRDELKYSLDTLLTASSSSVASVAITTTNLDTVDAVFSLQSTTGFKDSEERKIPVFNIGSEETNGAFYILQKDTSVSYIPARDGEEIEVYAQNNTLDILLKELDHLRNYPYYCMEQIASKLKGLLMEKEIRAVLKQPFKNEKEISPLLKKLLDGQLYDGGWSWWEKGKANLDISIYVVETLLPLRSNPLVENSVRNGLLFLQNQMSHAENKKLLYILSAMSSANHMIDYKTSLNKIIFDSLNQHQQWIWVKICQQQKLDYKRQLNQLISKATETMTGGIHWGSETYHWFNNNTATTILAFSVLSKEPDQQQLLPKIVQYFLEQKKRGYWRNTFESASITSAILPYIISTNNNFNTPAIINLAGDTSITITSFPYSNKIPMKSKKPITVTKSGGGNTYLTLYQKWWNKDPKEVRNNFDIETYFEKNKQKILTIPAGEKVNLIVEVRVTKDAEYVMIEIPIPAGCNYSNKKQGNWEMHKEFFKNKVVVFAESLSKGIHRFEVELEPRYKGSFTLNPAKAELMYFPTFYGRNEMRRVLIK